MTASTEAEMARGMPADRSTRRRLNIGKTSVAYPLYIAASIAPRAAMFVVLIVLTRLLPIAEYGLFALVVTTGEIVEISSTNWVRVYLLRTEAGAASLKPRRLGRALVLSAGGALAGLATSAAIAPFISSNRTAEMTIAVGVYIAAFALLRITLALLQLSRSHAAYAVLECGRGASMLAATVVVALLQPHSFLPTSIALSLATGGSATLGLVFVSRHLPRPVLPLGGYLAAIAFGVPYVLSNTLLYTLGWFDRFIINYYLGPAEVGLYVAAFSLARQPVDLFVGSLNAFTFPMLVHAYANGGAAKAGPVQSGLLTTMTALGVGIVAALALLGEPIANVLFPPSYSAEIGKLIPWIALASFMLALKQFVFDNSLHATQRNWLLLFPMVTPAVVSIGCGILLVRSFGLPGATANFLMVSMAAMLSTAVLSFRVFVFTIPWRDLAKIVVSALASGAAAWAVTAHYGWTPVVGLVMTGLVFCAVYGASLTMAGFSLRRLIETPWAPLSDRIQEEDSTSSNIAI